MSYLYEINGFRSRISRQTIILTFSQFRLISPLHLTFLCTCFLYFLPFLSFCFIFDFCRFQYLHSPPVPSFTRGGGVLTLIWYMCQCLLGWGAFCEIWYSDRGGGFHHYIIWVYVGQIIVKSTQFGQNWVFFSENGRPIILMGGKLDKNWYRESQIFEVRQAHPRTILVRVTPQGLTKLS